GKPRLSSSFRKWVNFCRTNSGVVVSSGSSLISRSSAAALAPASAHRRTVSSPLTPIPSLLSTCRAADRLMPSLTSSDAGSWCSTGGGLGPTGTPPFTLGDDLGEKVPRRQYPRRP